MFIRYFYLVITLYVFSSCSTTRNSSFLSNIQKSSCNQENTYTYSKDEIPAPLYNQQTDTLLSHYFTFKDLNVANAIGVLSLLSDYVQKNRETVRDPSLQNQVDLIKIRQELNHRIDLASLEISSVTAELDCEEEMLNQIASFLAEKEKRRETLLTVGSIILGSLSAIITGILVSKHDDSNATDMLGVGVGVADATLGILMLTGSQKIDLAHKRNILREIWFATETSASYPPAIWYYLNYKNPQEEEGSLREQLIRNWLDFGQLNGTEKDRRKLDMEVYFGDAGTYSIDEIENRAKMYDQIESLIKLMKQDLRNLTSSIGVLK
ncbi:MAG: hypothetical protein LC117_06975 [Bacteroidia bacterium]|nr:hypothetical protein [Bacteroidia bacterium]MCZ2277653.1 hypothetical protein [Bacteroidia bacterium]